MNLFTRSSEVESQRGMRSAYEFRGTVSITLELVMRCWLHQSFWVRKSAHGSYNTMEARLSVLKSAIIANSPSWSRFQHMNMQSMWLVSSLLPTVSKPNLYTGDIRLKSLNGRFDILYTRKIWGREAELYAGRRNGYGQDHCGLYFV